MCRTGPLQQTYRSLSGGRAGVDGAVESVIAHVFVAVNHRGSSAVAFLWALLKRTAKLVDFFSKSNFDDGQPLLIFRHISSCVGRHKHISSVCLQVRARER
jgi:hypothetical protein